MPTTPAAADRPDVRAVVLDVDGTVLTSRASVSPATVDAVSRVGALGVPVILASSRSPRGLAPVQAALGLPGQYLVAYQGALSGRLQADGPGFEPLHEVTMSACCARSVVALAGGEGYRVGWYSGLDWFVDEVDARVRAEMAVTGEVPTVSPLPLLDRPAHKLLCIGPTGTAPSHVNDLARRLPAGTVGRRSHSTYLEVTAAAADKPVGVAAIAERLGFDAAQVAAFGDGDNDLGMFAYAGVRVAMGNATPAVTAAATMTTGDHDRDGVADALDRLLRAGALRAPG